MIPMAALPEVARDTGLRFSPGDDEALAHCLEMVLGSSDYALGARQRTEERIMEYFTECGMVVRRLTVYSELTRGSPRSRPRPVAKAGGTATPAHHI